MHSFIEGQVGGSVTVRAILPRASIEFLAQMYIYPRSPKCYVQAVHKERIIRHFCRFVTGWSGLRWMTNAAQDAMPEYWEEKHDLFIRAWTPLLGLWAACEILHPPSALWDGLTTTLETLEPFGDLLPWTSICFLVTLMRGQAQWGERRTEEIHPAVGKSRAGFSWMPSGRGDVPLTLTAPCFGEEFKTMLYCFIHHFYLFFSLDYNWIAFKVCSYMSKWHYKTVWRDTLWSNL